MLKIGIAGMGTMGWVHALRYLQMPDARLVAIADLDPERLEAKERVQGNLPAEEGAFDFSEVARYAEASDLIAEADVDVVDICLPTDLHARYTVEALEAGHHVLCEKPMALTVEDADRMVAAAEQAGRLLMIAQCIRFWPEYVFLREQIQSGRYGRLLSLSLTRVVGRPRWSKDSWFADPKRSGGALFDLHIHDADYVNALFGPPDRLHAVGRSATEAGGYDIVHVCFDYDDGPQVHLHAGWSNAQIPFQAGYDAWFERGFIRYAGGQVTVFDNLEQVEGHPADYEPGDAYYNEIAYFLRAVEAGTPPEVCLPTSTRDSVALIHRELAAIERR